MEPAGSNDDQSKKTWGIGAIVMVWRKAEQVLDYSAEFMGWLAWILILYCMILGVTDVFLRYALNAASLWIGATIQAAMVLMACTAGIYAFKHNSFVKLDLLYANLSAKKKAVCDILTSVYSFLFLGVLIWKGITSAQLSWMLNQVTPTAVPIPIYPIKTFIPVAACLVLLLLIRQLVHDVRILMGKEQAQ